jgi:hypothetical protein
MSAAPPEVVIVFTGISPQGTEHTVKLINGIYGPTVMPVFIHPGQSVAVYGCEKIEAPSLAALVDQIVDKHMVETEAQALYEALWARGHRKK